MCTRATGWNWTLPNKNETNQSKRGESESPLFLLTSTRLQARSTDVAELWVTSTRAGTLQKPMKSRRRATPNSRNTSEPVRRFGVAFPLLASIFIECVSGTMKIARRFSAGLRTLPFESVPLGTTETQRRLYDSVVPAALTIISTSQPASELAAYFRWSLRDACLSRI